MSDVIIVNSSYKKKLFPIKDITAKFHISPNLAIFQLGHPFQLLKEERGRQKICISPKTSKNKKTFLKFPGRRETEMSQFT